MFPGATAFGEVPFAATPTVTVLELPSKELQYVAELKPLDPDTSTVLTLRYTSGLGFATGASDTPSHVFFEPRMKQPALMKRDMFASGKTSGRSRVGYGDLVLINNDGELDDLEGYAWDGRDVKIWRGEEGDVFPADFEEVLVGSMEQVQVDVNEVRVKVRDRQALVDVPLQDNLYAGDNSLPAGLEGVEDLKGKPKPLCYGVVKNVSPPMVNSAKLIYQVNDGAVDSVDAVYDRGKRLRGGMAFTSQTSGFGSDFIEDVAYSDDLDLWVAVGQNGKLFTSPDGETWTSRTSQFGSSIIQAVHYADGLFVAVGTSAKISTSTDGLTWTARTADSSGNWVDVTWSEKLGLWVAVGGVTSPIIDTSPDGVTWTARTVPGSDGLSGVDWSPVRQIFVAVGDNGHAVTSTDGTSWSANATGLDSLHEYEDIAWGRDRFVTVNRGGEVAVSQDGIVWSARDAAFSGWEGSAVAFESIRYGGGLFVATGLGGLVASSVDGSVFIQHDSGSTEDLVASGYGDGFFIVAGTNGDLLTSSKEGTYASEADLLDDDLAPEPGTYKVYADGGYIRLGSPPDGQVTADVTQGASASDRTAAQIWTQLLEKAGRTSADWKAADITALDGDNSAEIGLWVGTSEVQASAKLTEVARSVGAWWGLDRKGIFRIELFDDPAGQTAALSLDDNRIVRGSFKRVPEKGEHRGLPVWRVRVLYGKNWTVQDQDVAAGVSDARKAELAQEWKEESDEDATVAADHLLASTLVVETLMADSADASAEATRLLSLRGTKRDRFELVTELDSDTVVVDLGTILDLSHPRYGLSSGKEFVVISVDPDARSRQVRLGVWA